MLTFRTAAEPDFEHVNRLARQVHELHVSLHPDLYRSVKHPISCEEFREMVERDQVAKNIAARVGYDVAIVDINDLEGQILGASSKAVNKKLYARILKDNPLGQDDQQTPMGIIRRVD